MDLKIGSFNVKGMGSKIKRLQLFQWIKNNDYDICFIQETHVTTKDKSQWEMEWGGDAYFSGEFSNKEGICILIKPGLEYKTIQYENVMTGRIQILKICISDNDYTLINLYGPNENSLQFYQNLEIIIESVEFDNLIIGGDFNIIINPDLDKKNGRKESNTKTREKLSSIMNKFDIHDIWRILNPNTKKFTWHSNTKPPIFCRLDYFLISENLINRVSKCKITTGYKSDHSMVYFCLQTQCNKRGPGYFKLNNSLLLKPEYQELIRRNISLTAEINQNANPNTLWEVIKGTIRNETIKYASAEKKNDINMEKMLIGEIDQLETKYAENISEDILTEINDKKEVLQTLHDKKVNGIILRSKAEWIEGGEKNSKYFANLERKRSEKKTITRLTINNKTITSNEEILHEERAYYEKLYSLKETHSTTDSFFLNNDEINTCTLSEENKQICEGNLSEYECSISLKEMKNNKSPGSDGLTVEFYKIFWNDIKRYYIASLNHSLATGALSDLQKQSIITLIPKKDSDLSILTNWRPISLLNVDYKIASKAIANRIKKILPSIIDQSQTGFLKGRYIGENIRTLYESIDYLNERNLPGLFFFADFEKAFDTVDHIYLQKVMQKFNFGNDILKWIRLFYSDAKSCVSNNGYMSDFFSIKRGVRQGCPLSPYLFIIAIEILSKAIINEKDITGVKIGDIELKNTMFADDATFITDGTRKSFEKLIFIIDEFSKISGLNLNTKKSTVMRIGVLKNEHFIFCPDKKFIWTSFSAKTLGITFLNDNNEIHEYNILPKIIDFEQCLDKWNHRKLSLLGKITVIKTFAAPKLIYPLTVLHDPPENMIKRIKNKLFAFLWDNKPDKIKRDTIIQSYEKGGLKMVDIENFIISIRASWVKRICDPTNTGKWKLLYERILERYGGKLLFECNLNSEDAKYIAEDNKFLNNVLKSWANINYSATNNIISKEIIWNNSNLKIENKPIFLRDWFGKGVKHIEHLYDYRVNRFLRFTDFAAIFNIRPDDFIKYQSILNSIDTSWIDRLKTEHINIQNQFETLISKVLKSKYVNKLLYTTKINKKNTEEIKSEHKWANEFSDDNLCWPQIYTLIFDCTIDSTLRNFQYKYLMRILGTNKLLFRCRIVNSSLCDFCSMYVETIRHIFWECTQVQHFWSQLRTYLNDKDIAYELNYQTISLGIKEKTLLAKQFNFIIILAKYFIFKCKYEKRDVAFESFTHYLKNRIHIEEEIATIKEKREQHIVKWGRFTI